jgi:hypothetical protein
MTDEHFVNVTLRCEWKLSQSSPVSGCLRTDLPESFLVASSLFRVPIHERASSWETILGTCIEYFFVDCAIRRSFIFRMAFSPDKFHDEVFAF